MSYMNIGGTIQYCMQDWIYSPILRLICTKVVNWNHHQWYPSLGTGNRRDFETSKVRPVALKCFYQKCHSVDFFTFGWKKVTEVPHKFLEKFQKYQKELKLPPAIILYWWWHLVIRSVLYQRVQRFFSFCNPVMVDRSCAHELRRPTRPPRPLFQSWRSLCYHWGPLFCRLHHSA